MLARSAWQEVLVQAGFVNELAWPTQESSPLRQHLLVARSPGVNRPDKAAVRRYLQQRFGSGLPALRIRQQEALLAPLRTPSVAQIAPAESTPVAGGDPTLEKQVAELWQSLLSRPVARLMATRMVAQLNRRGIASASLQDLFTHSTLSDFCAHLQACSSAEDNPVLICHGAGDETLFIFHASDGDISAWLPLARALDRRVFGLQAKSPQRFATLDRMIDEYVAGMVPKNLTRQAAETWIDNIAHLLRLLAGHTPGEAVALPCLILHAVMRPARWTPAETEWRAWMDRADRYAIKASHWQIMLEPPHVQACSQHIQRWLGATSTQPENTL